MLLIFFFFSHIRTISVEYNQLDTLLRSTNYPEGDVNDSNTGYSPFPGNINQLIFDLDHYVNILKETRGAMPEFVNPKYKDETKTVFKKPTRLECMMQVCLFLNIQLGEKPVSLFHSNLGLFNCY